MIEVETRHFVSCVLPASKIHGELKDSITGVFSMFRGIFDPLAIEQSDTVKIAVMSVSCTFRVWWFSLAVLNCQRVAWWVRWVKVRREEEKDLVSQEHMISARSWRLCSFTQTCCLSPCRWRSFVACTVCAETALGMWLKKSCDIQQSLTFERDFPNWKASSLFCLWTLDMRTKMMNCSRFRQGSVFQGSGNTSLQGSIDSHLLPATSGRNKDERRFSRDGRCRQRRWQLLVCQFPLVEGPGYH